MHHEYQRLLAVNRFKSLTDGIGHDLDNIAQLAGQICEMPVTLITLIDDKMQWFKAKRGVTIDCNERESSFCNVTIAQDNLLMVTDTLADERFANLPVVVNEPHVRFYAGIALTTYDGYAVGTICVLDIKPGTLNELQQNSLQTLAKQAVNVLELNWSLRSLAEQHDNCQAQKHDIEQYAMKLNAVFNSSKDIHILLNKHYQILAFNRAAQAYAYNSNSQPLELNTSLLNYVSPVRGKRLLAYFNSALSGLAHQTQWQVQSGDATCWLDVFFTPVSNEEDEVIGVAINATDVTLTRKHAAQVDEQNAALQRIATFQSHELRRPVASLMGIIDLIKDEPVLANHTYVSMMASAVDELDYKIRGIVKDAESTIYG